MYSSFQRKQASRLPWMTLLLTSTALLFSLGYQGLAPMQQHMLIEIAGANPSQLAAGFADGWVAGFKSAGRSLILAQFIHSSWLHLLGNLAYLWVFGFAVERRVGALSMAVVFMLGGILSYVMVALRMPGLDLPVIGASGAVSAIVGAYLGLFPRGRIGLYLPLGVFVQFVQVPALLVIGSWFALQLVYSTIGPISGAMAWWTHLAGFAMGLMIALLARAFEQVKE